VLKDLKEHKELQEHKDNKVLKELTVCLVFLALKA
jgi:hypothetical protein